MIICTSLAIYIIPKIYIVFSQISIKYIDRPVDIPGEIPFTWTNINTWSLVESGTQNQSTWSSVLTWGQISLIDNLNTNYKKTIYYLEQQPTQIPAWYSYNQRSQVIIDYMTKNTIQLRKTNSEKWYMYVKLAKKPNYPIFIYWHWSEVAGYKRSGNLNLADDIWYNEYAFDLSKIPYNRFYDWKYTTYNWLNDLNNWKSLFLALASKWFDWNYIKEVRIYLK